MFSCLSINLVVIIFKWTGFLMAIKKSNSLNYHAYSNPNLTGGRRRQTVKSCIEDPIKYFVWQNTRAFGNPVSRHVSETLQCQLIILNDQQDGGRTSRAPSRWIFLFLRVFFTKSYEEVGLRSFSRVKGQRPPSWKASLASICQYLVNDWCILLYISKQTILWKSITSSLAHITCHLILTTLCGVL